LLICQHGSCGTAGKLATRLKSSRLIPGGKSAVTWLSPHQPAVFVYFQITDWLDMEHLFSFVFIYVQIIFKDIEQD